MATSLHFLKAGSDNRISGGGKEIEIHLVSDIPSGHKVAIAEIEAGAHVIKFGEVIGAATKKIEKGEHVHTQNLATLHGRGSIK